MPIDRSYRETWTVIEREDRCPVWASEEQEGEIHGSIAGVHLESCIGCEKCITACPTDVFEPWTDDAGRYVVVPIKEQDCILCLVCEMVCPTDAIHVVRRAGSQDTLDSLLRGAQ